MKLEDYKNQFTPKLHTSKSRLKGKLYINKKYVSKNFNSKNVSLDNRNIKSVDIKRNKLKSVKSKDNITNNINDYMSEQDEPSIGIQAYINAYDKVDKAIYIGKTPINGFKTISSLKRTINNSRNVSNEICSERINKRFIVKREVQKVVKANIRTYSNKVSNKVIKTSNGKTNKVHINYNSPPMKNKPSGKINKKYLLKVGGRKFLKDSVALTVNTKNRVVDNARDSDGSSGVQAYLHADKNIRRSLDAAKSTKNVITGATKATKFSSKVLNSSGNYIKERITKNKNVKYQNIKSNISKSNKIKTGSKKAKVNNVLIKNAKKEIAQKHIYRKKAISAVKSIYGNVRNILKPAIILSNPYVLIGVALFLLIIIIISASGSIVSAVGQNYFISDDEVALKYKEEVEKLDNDLKVKISSLENDDSYDSTKVIYIGDNQDINTNFQEIFALAAVKFEQDLTFSYKEEEFIEEIHLKIYDIRVSTERYTEIVDGKKEKMIRKIIIVYAYDMETVMNKLKYDDEQKSWSRRLVSNFSEQFTEFSQQYGELTQEEIDDLINNAPKLSNIKQKKIYETALSIVGKVKYFWGGKSSAGWNDKWGKPTLVTSPGNETTGTYIPYGLDCSGYVDWVYKTSGIGKMLSGGGTAYQWGQSYPINRDDLQVGDLAFLQMPNSSGINHVGIYVGKDKDGNNLYAHSEWGTGATVNGFKGFKYFRRVVRFE